MVFLELYREKASASSLELENEHIDPFLENGAENLEVNEVVCLFLLIDRSTKESVLSRVRTLFSKYSGEEKVVVFDALIDHVDSLNTENFIACISGTDYVTGPSLFASILSSNNISCIDKYILYSDVLNEEVSGKTLYDLTKRIIEVCKSVLTSSDSLKGEVRMSVALLRRIAKELEVFRDVESLVIELYENNELWREFYCEEAKHRHKVLIESYGDKVSAAFRNKDYKRVIRLVGEYEDELPETLKKKLEYSKKHLGQSGSAK